MADIERLKMKQWLDNTIAEVTEELNAYKDLRRSLDDDSDDEVNQRVVAVIAHFIGQHTGVK